MIVFYTVNVFTEHTFKKSSKALQIASNISGTNILMVFFSILNNYCRVENELLVAKNRKVTLSLDSAGIANLILVFSF